MLIAGFPAGPWGTNCYVVATGPGSECVVVDPGKDAADGVAEVVREHRLKPVSVLVTHGHIDHMWCVAPVAGTYDATAWIHPADRHLLSDPMAGMSRETAGMLLGGSYEFAEPDDVAELADGQSLELAGLGFVVDHTPGHTRGSVTFRTPYADQDEVSRGHVLRRPALRGLDRPHRPPRRGPPDDAAQPARRRCSPCPTTSWCCPATVSRPRSAGSERPTRSSRTSTRSTPPAASREGSDDARQALRPEGRARSTFPPDSAAFRAVHEALAAPAVAAGYGYVELPVFEDTSLFVRGVGESTDVVSKEMYTFTDRGGRSLTLRPEGTAGVIRSVIEHGLDRGQLPVKLWYAGPFFRAERPQHGRYRQLQQFGVEAIGSDDPALDAEVITIADDGYRSLGLTGFRLEVTSLGCAACRPPYRELLVAFLAGLDLDEATRQRAALNPLRVLDDKRPEVQAQLADAPLMHRPPVRRLRRPLRRGPRPARRDRRAARGQPADGARARLLHAHHVRVRARRPRRPVRHRRRRPLRRPDGRPRWPGAVRHRLRARRRPHLPRVPGRGARRRARARPRRLRRAARGERAPAPPCWPRSCAGPASAPTSPTAAAASRAR